jgi:ParB/RepB/Spo0J family partition protein
MSKRTAASEPHDVKLPVISLALERIRVDETKNLRRFNPDAKSVEELALDIRENGMLNPVLVKKLVHLEGTEVTDHDFELVAGYQRMKAVGYLNDNGNKIDSVSASVVEVPEDSANRRSKILNLKENLRRSDISYIDAAYAIKELQDSGMTAGEIAKEFKKSGAWVSYVSKMLNLRAEVQKKIHSGVINFRLAKTLPDMTEEEQDTAISEVEKGSTGSGVASRAKAKKPRKNKRGKKAKEDATENRNISSKQAILQLEEMAGEMSKESEEGEKRNKADQAAMEYAAGLYKDIVKFLSGGIGIKALHNRVMKGV